MHLAVSSLEAQRKRASRHSLWVWRALWKGSAVPWSESSSSERRCCTTLQWPRNFMELPRMTVFVSSGSWDHAELGKASTYGLSVQLVRLRSASTFRKLNASWFPIGTCHDLTSIWQARLSETTPPSWIWNHGLSECSPAMPFPVMPWSGPQRKAKPAFPKTPRDVCKGWLREMVSRVLLLLGFDAHLFAFATCFCVLQCRGGTKRFRKATRTYADLTRVTQTPEGGHAVSFLVRKSIV